MCEGEKSGWDAAGRRVGGAALSRVRSLDFWKRRLPFLAWLPTYNFESFFCDCIAGTRAYILRLRVAVFLPKRLIRCK
jgi:hypothetical protein